MAIIAFLLLLTASIASSVGASTTIGSKYYTTDINIQNANKYLTIATALGWSSVVLLAIILIMGFATGAFNTGDFTAALADKSLITTREMNMIEQDSKNLRRGNTIQVIVIIVFIIVAIITFVVGIFSALAATALTKVTTRDTNFNTMYWSSVAAAIAGIGGILMIIIITILYTILRNTRHRNAAKLKTLENKLAINSAAQNAPKVIVSKPPVNPPLNPPVNPAVINVQVPSQEKIQPVVVNIHNPPALPPRPIYYQPEETSTLTLKSPGPVSRNTALTQAALITAARSTSQNTSLDEKLQSGEFTDKNVNSGTPDTIMSQRQTVSNNKSPNTNVVTKNIATPVTAKSPERSSLDKYFPPEVSKSLSTRYTNTSKAVQSGVQSTINRISPKAVSSILPDDFAKDFSTGLINTASYNISKLF